MNKLLKPAYLPWIATAAGVVGLLLRIWLFATDVDSTGYLAQGHLGLVLLWVLTAAVAIVLLLGTRALTQASKYSFNFPPSPIGGIGCAIGGFSFAITSVMEMTSSPDTITAFASLLGLASAAALMLIGYGRWYGKRSNLLLHAVISVFLMLRLVSQYRHWSSSPQMTDYCFPLLATVFLMLASYHRAAFAADMGKRSSYVFFHLTAVYFCILSLQGTNHIVFYLGAGIWMLTDLCSLAVMHKKKREAS